VGLSTLVRAIVIFTTLHPLFRPRQIAKIEWTRKSPMIQLINRET